MPLTKPVTPTIYILGLISLRTAAIMGKYIIELLQDNSVHRCDQGLDLDRDGSKDGDKKRQNGG
jgi:hypothetical protein